MFLQPFPASVVRDAHPQSGPAAASTGEDDVRRSRFSALLTDALARSRPPTAPAHDPAVQTPHAPEPKERRTDAETRPGMRDREPDSTDRAVSEADDPAVDEQGPIALPAAAPPPEEGGAMTPVLPSVPAAFAPPPDRAPSDRASKDPAPGVNVPTGTAATVVPAGAGPDAAASTSVPALSPEQPTLPSTADATQPSRRAAGRSVHAPQTAHTEPPAAERTVAAAGRTDGTPAAEAANFSRAVMAAAGTPVRLSVVSDPAPGVVPAGTQAAATAAAQAQAHGTAHPSAAETLTATAQAAQSGVLPQEGASLQAPANALARTDALAAGAPAALVTAATAADLAAGGEETAGFAFRDGAVSGRFAVAGKAGTRAGIAPKSTPDQVAVHISRAARSGTNRIEIRLDPESLGHVEVRLEVGRDGRVSALVLTENREALDALKAEARALQQALQDAGLKPDADSLSFDMRSEYGRRSATQPFFPEDREARAPADLAGQGELQSPFQSAGPHRSSNPRGQLDVLA